MREACGLDKMWRKPMKQADRFTDLGNLERVGEPSSHRPGHVRREDLRLPLEPPEGDAVYNPIAIPLELAAAIVRLALHHAPSLILASPGVAAPYLVARLGGHARARIRMPFAPRGGVVT